MNKEKLQATMTDEQKVLFEKYTDCLILQSSFKPGAKTMLEITEE